MMRHLLLSCTLLLVTMPQALTADMDLSKPSDVPDDIGLGERLALISWLKEQQISIPADKTRDIEWLRGAYYKKQGISAQKTDTSADDKRERQALALKLWKRHARNPPEGASLAEVRALLTRLDAEEAAKQKQVDAEADARLAAQVKARQAREAAAALRAKDQAQHRPADTKQNTTTQDQAKPARTSGLGYRPKLGFTQFQKQKSEAVRFYLMQRDNLMKLSQAHRDASSDNDELDRAIDLSTRYWSRIPGHPLAYEVNRMLSKMVKAGCRDPAIDWLCGMLSLPELRKDSLTRAYKALEKTEGPLYLKLIATRQLADLYLYAKTDAGKATYEQYVKWGVKDGLAALKIRRFTGVEKSMYVRVLGQLINIFRLEAYQKVWIAAYSKELEDNKAGIDRWLFECLSGYVHVAKAWLARGNQRGSRVSKEQWASFHEHMNIAARHFEKAYRIDPDIPEAAAGRLATCMGNSEDTKTIMAWLHKAIDAVPDNDAAYRMAMEALSWRGSTADIMEVGRMGVKTGAWDTSAPWQYMKALKKCYGYPLRSSRRLLSTKGYIEQFWPEIKAVVDGYANHNCPDYVHIKHLIRRACFYYRFGFEDEIKSDLRGPCRGKLDPQYILLIGGPEKQTKEMFELAGQTYPDEP